MRPLASYARRAALGLTLLLAALLAVRHLDPLTPGLTATYFRDAEFRSTPATVRTEEVPSTDSLASAWPDGQVPETFSATWTGSILAVRNGRYTFATESDDGSWLYVDGRLVVDNGGPHERRRQTGSIDLDRGVHSLFIEYFQDGGQMAVATEWSYGGAPLAPIPGWVLSVRHAKFARTLASVIVRRAMDVLAWVWMLAVAVAALLTAAVPARGWIRRSLDDRYRRTLAYVIAGATLLDLLGLWWGLPAGWAGDEVTPIAVFQALSAHFAGGWFSRYPPLLFYVLAIVEAPVLWLRANGWFLFSPAAQDTVLFVLGRLVSVAAAAGTLVAVYACGARTFGRRAGLAAATAFAVVAPFVFYAKTANVDVPYLFWFALSLLCCARALETGSGRDILLLFATATAAICTKDQAYALYLPLPFIIVAALWRANRASGRRSPLVRAILDGRLWVALAVSGALFAAIQNLPFNAAGFMNHLHDILGPGRGYRVFDATASGEWRLFTLTLNLDRSSWGWPFFLIGLCGLAIALADRQRREFAVVQTAIVLSYYVAFIAIIGYNYDRFLLPICLIQTLWVGVAVDAFLADAGRARAWRRALLLAVVAYTGLYAGTVDVLMMRDSRYAAEQWLDAHAGPDRLVGTMFPHDVLPRMAGFSWVDISSVDNLDRWKPPYFVLNADYAREMDPDSAAAQITDALHRERLGYRLAARFRAPAPWPWLPAPHPDLVGPREERLVFSFLSAINPTIEIYARE